MKTLSFLVVSILKQFCYGCKKKPGRKRPFLQDLNMGKLVQIHTAISASFGALLTGVLFVWPSYTLGVYKAENGTVLSAPLSEFEAAMLSSLPSLGAMLGTAIAGTIIERAGRKRGGLLLALPFALSWGLIEVSTSIIPILIGRFFGGVAGGAFQVFSPMFISEVAEDSIRGTLASFPILFYCSGTLVSYFMGWFLNYHMTIWANLALSALCVGLLMTVTESPIFLLRNKRNEEACAAIAKYRGLSKDSKEVLEEISRLNQQICPAVEMETVTVTETEEKSAEPNKEKVAVECGADEVRNIRPIKLLFSSFASRQGFVIVGLALGLQVLMGIVPVQVYAKDLFSSAVPDMSSHMCSVLFSLVLVAGSCTQATLIDRAGRRFLIITSCIMVALCMVTLGVMLQTKAGPAWLSVVVLLMYCFFFCFGAGTIPYVLLAEMFAPEVQSIASMLLVEWVWFLNFVIIGVFPFFIKTVGFYGTCYFFAFTSIVNCITSYYLIPETKGLSNQQVQETLLRRRKRSYMETETKTTANQQDELLQNNSD